MTQRPQRLAGLLLLATLLYACHEKEKPAAASKPADRNAPIPVEAFVVKSKVLTENIEVPGTLLPYEETEIRPEISGRLTGLYFKEGARIQKGALMAKLFDGDLQAQLAKLKVQLGIAQKTLERQQALLKISGISQQEVDLSELEVNNIKADIELVKVDIDKTEIRAPYTGQLGLRNVSNGAYVTPTTILTTLRQVDDLKLDFTVPEKYSGNFSPGKKVSFRIEGKDRTYPATVLATESGIATETRSLRVRAHVKGNEQGLVPGAFAKVSLMMGGSQPSLIIPTQAVIPQSRNKQVILYKNGAPDFTIVETGIRDSSFIQITEGLQAGDTVITTGLLAIKPQSTIRLTSIQ